MNVPSKDQIKELMQVREQPCISLFFSTARGGPDMQQNRMKLVNQVREVERRFQSGEVAAGQRNEPAKLLAPIHHLLEDSAFWQHPGDGVAVLRSWDRFHVYCLPFHVKEHIAIASHFYCKPFLTLLNDGPFYILAVSQNEIRLLKGTRYGIQAVAVPDTVPENLAQALRYEDPENQLRYYSSSAGGASPSQGGRRAVIFYGHGGAADAAKDYLLDYFRQIDKGLHELFHDQHAPLILAGVGYLLPLYRQANTYPHLIEQGVEGNPELLNEKTLHEHAWTVAEPFVLKEQQEALALYRDREQTDQASANISDIVPAAYYGRVTDLFVALDDEQWGSFHPTTYSLEIHETPHTGDDDLLDAAATQTLLHGGSVYALARAHMPGEVSIAALFRY